MKIVFDEEVSDFDSYLHGVNIFEHFENSDQGIWIKERISKPLKWIRTLHPDTLNYRYIVQAEISDADYIFYTLKFK